MLTEKGEALLGLMQKVEVSGQIIRDAPHIDISATEFVEVMRRIEAEGFISRQEHPEQDDELRKLVRYKRSTAIHTARLQVFEMDEKEGLYLFSLLDGTLMCYRYRWSAQVGVWWAGGYEKEFSWPEPQDEKQLEVEQAYLAISARYMLGEHLTPSPEELISVLNKSEAVFFLAARQESDRKKRDAAIVRGVKWRQAILKLASAKPKARFTDDNTREVGSRLEGQFSSYSSYELFDDTVITLKRGVGSSLWWIGAITDEPARLN